MYKDTYKIMRYYGPESDKTDTVIYRGLTLQEAKDHCAKDYTSGKDWFDGYMREKEDEDGD